LGVAGEAKDVAGRGLGPQMVRALLSGTQGSGALDGVARKGTDAFDDSVTNYSVARKGAQPFDLIGIGESESLGPRNGWREVECVASPHTTHRILKWVEGLFDEMG